MVLVSYQPYSEHRTVQTNSYVFALAAVRRLLHAALCDILPRRGEPYDHRGVYHCLFYEVDEQLRTIPKTPKPTSGPVRSSPWGCCMP